MTHRNDHCNQVVDTNIPTGVAVGFIPFVSDRKKTSDPLAMSLKKEKSKFGKKDKKTSTKENTSKVNSEIEKLMKRIECLEETNKEKDKTIKDLQQQLRESQKSKWTLLKQYERICLLWLRTTGSRDQVAQEHLEAASACAAASRGDVEALKNMISQNASILKESIENRTALHEAALANKEECLCFLLESGADANKKDRHGVTPLQEAIRARHGNIAVLVEQAVANLQKKRLRSELWKVEYVDPLFVGPLKSQLANTYPSTSSQSPSKDLPVVFKWVKNRSVEAPLPDNPAGDLVGSGSKKKSTEVNFFKKLVTGGHHTTKRIDPESKDNSNREEDGSVTHRATVPSVPHGTAFGLLRGLCLVPKCDCNYYADSGKGSCACGHFPTSHKNLGRCDVLLAGLMRLEPTENSIKVIVPKYAGQEWPKLLNLNLTPNTNLSDFGELIKKDLPVWLIKGQDLEFHEEIGHGTSAIVYRGTYITQTVAIKVVEIQPGHNKAKQYKDLFQEFNIMTSFMGSQFGTGAQQNSNLFVKLYGVATHPRLCLVMEFCDQGSLFHLLQKDTFSLDWSLLLSWFKATVLGIKTLHSLDPPIVHRDIKTLNLLITERNEIRISDFGLSRFIRGRQDSKAYSTLTKLRGTYCYSAPEVYFGSPYTTKSDVFSLGIVLWELVYKCVTGKYSNPYSEFPQSYVDFQIIIQVAKNGLRPTIPPNVPPELAQLIQFLWHGSPLKRPEMSQLEDSVSFLEGVYQSNKHNWDQCRASEGNGTELIIPLPLQHSSGSGLPAGVTAYTTLTLTPPSGSTPGDISEVVTDGSDASVSGSSSHPRYGSPRTGTDRSSRSETPLDRSEAPENSENLENTSVNVPRKSSLDSSIRKERHLSVDNRVYTNKSVLEPTRSKNGKSSEKSRSPDGAIIKHESKSEKNLARTSLSPQPTSPRTRKDSTQEKKSPKGGPLYYNPENPSSPPKKRQE